MNSHSNNKEKAFALLRELEDMLRSHNLSLEDHEWKSFDFLLRSLLAYTK